MRYLYISEILNIKFHLRLKMGSNEAVKEEGVSTADMNTTANYMMLIILAVIGMAGAVVSAKKKSYKTK